MGGSSKQTEDKTVKNTIDPGQMQQYQDNYARAEGAAQSLTPYTGQITAGFNPTQIQSQGVLSGIATDPRYRAANQNAMDTVQGVLGTNINSTITPQGVTATPYTPSSYDAAQQANTDLSPYMNPYQKNVIDASVAQNGYARDQQAVKDNATATAAHAFGGTRQAVQNAETTAGYDRNNEQNLAALNSANFSQAQNAAGSDVAARNAANAFNASSANAAGQFNAGQNLNAGEFSATQNQNAQQQTFANNLAAMGLKMNAAGQLVALNQADLQTATQQGGILASVGDAQQAQTQKALTDAYAAYTQGQQLTLAQQQLLSQALGMIPVQTTQQSNGTTTTQSNPGVGGILGGVASLGLGLAGMPTSSLGGGLLSGLFGGASKMTAPQLSAWNQST